MDSLLLESAVAAFSTLTTTNRDTSPAIRHRWDANMTFPLTLSRQGLPSSSSNDLLARILLLPPATPVDTWPLGDEGDHHPSNYNRNHHNGHADWFLHLVRTLLSSAPSTPRSFDNEQNTKNTNEEVVKTSNTRNNLEHILSWLPQGQIWRIHNVKAFVQDVLPRLPLFGQFHGMTTWSTSTASSTTPTASAVWELFLALCRVKGMTILSQSPHAVAFYHPDFSRDNHDDGDDDGDAVHFLTNFVSAIQGDGSNNAPIPTGNTTPTTTFLVKPGRGQEKEQQLPPSSSATTSKSVPMNQCKPYTSQKNQTPTKNPQGRPLAPPPFLLATKRNVTATSTHETKIGRQKDQTSKNDEEIATTSSGKTSSITTRRNVKTPYFVQTSFGMQPVRLLRSQKDVVMPLAKDSKASRGDPLAKDGKSYNKNKRKAINNDPVDSMTTKDGPYKVVVKKPRKKWLPPLGPPESVGRNLQLLTQLASIRPQRPLSSLHSDAYTTTFWFHDNAEIFASLTAAAATNNASRENAELTN